MTDQEQIAALVARQRQELTRRWVILCSCENWLTCEHPWPALVPSVTVLRRLESDLISLNPESNNSR